MINLKYLNLIDNFFKYLMKKPRSAPAVTPAANF